MNLSTSEILRNTNYGLEIYAKILCHHYPDEIVLKLSGKSCETTKNPYNKSKHTLCIYLVDDVFYFNDLENIDLKGDPFDFAELHYKCKGDELLHLICNDLYLKKSNYPQSSCELPKFSLFKQPITNTFPLQTVDINAVYQIINNEIHLEPVKKLRSITDEKLARKY
ncbi:MAG: hypothetical protein PF541_10195, partial [Prolixibacteraceae bacterium]|nr:hypothetical protein [Prolixibacteraceae bacterium]